MATWGGSTQCPLGEDEDDEDYPSELGAQDDEDEEEGAESSSTDESHSYCNRKPCSSKNRERCVYCVYTPHTHFKKYSFICILCV